MASRKISTSLFTGLFILALTWRASAQVSQVPSQVEVNMEDRVEVFLGDTAQISCMFTSTEGIGGIMIQWLVMNGDVRQRIYYRDSTMAIVDPGTTLSERISVNGTGASGEVVLIIRDVQLQDEREFICQVTSLTEGKSEGRTRLRVFQTPELPSIEGVHTGISVNNENPSKIGSCEVKNGFPRPNITWYRDQTPLHNSPDTNVGTVTTVQSSGLFTVNSELRILVRKEDGQARFYCEVSYHVPGGTRMTESNRITVTVHYPTTAINVWVESPKGRVKESDTVEIRCQGDGNPQPVLTFFKHEEADPMETSDSDDRVVLRDVTRLDSGRFRCEVLDLDFDPDVIPIDPAETELVVDYLDAAVLEPKDTTVMKLEQEASVTCNALSSLPTHTVWYKDEKQVAEGHVLKLKGRVDTSGTYRCVVTVPSLEGLQTSGALEVHVQAPPVLSDPAETVLEQNVDQSVNLSCHATGYPAPTLTWTASDSQALKEVSHTQTKEGVTSTVSVKVTSDLTVRCNASSQQGTVAKLFTIKAISAEPESPKRIKKEGSGVIIAVVIILILLLAILGAVLYFLYKKGKICGRSGKQDLTKEKSSKDNIVVEMKSDNTEDSVLLQGANGEKKPPNNQ